MRNSRNDFSALREFALAVIDQSLAWQLPIEEVEHERRDLVALVLQREVAGVEQVQFRVGQIAQVRRAPSAVKITSFVPQTMRVGGLRSGRMPGTADIERRCCRSP